MTRLTKNYPHSQYSTLVLRRKQSFVKETISLCSYRTDHPVHEEWARRKEVPLVWSPPFRLRGCSHTCILSADDGHKYLKLLLRILFPLSSHAQVLQQQKLGKLKSTLPEQQSKGQWWTMIVGLTFIFRGYSRADLPMKLPAFSPLPFYVEGFHILGENTSTR